MKLLMLVLSMQCLAAQPLGENAALRYWSAFAQLKDTFVTKEQAKELTAILDGTAPYSDLKYRDLVQRNAAALKTLERGTLLKHCDWGLDYDLGPDAPIDYAGRALTLGRLNVLDAFHRLTVNDRPGAIRGLTTGLRFSQDVASGGPLFSALSAKHLIVTHLRGIDFATQTSTLTPAEKSTLLAAVDRTATAVDWEAAMRREFDLIRRFSKPTPAADLVELYVGALRDPAALPRLNQRLAATPNASRIPNPAMVIQAMQELSRQVQTTRGRLK